LHGIEPTLFRAFIINIEIYTNRLTPYLSEDRDSSYYQYGTHHVDTDEKKAELFGRGLSLLLQDRLVQFQDMSLTKRVPTKLY
jgi:hypothetical protein